MIINKVIFMERNTKQKKLILDNICNRYDHPTSEMIYNDLKKENDSIGLATIYRALKSLTDAGIIQKINTDKSAHYDYNRHNHCHLICNKCQKIIDVKLDDIFVKNIIDDFEIEKTGLQINGICKDCKIKGGN